MKLNGKIERLQLKKYCSTVERRAFCEGRRGKFGDDSVGILVSPLHTQVNGDCQALKSGRPPRSAGVASTKDAKTTKLVELNLGSTAGTRP